MAVLYYGPLIRCTASGLDPTHHDAGVELVEALHRAVTEAVAQVLLHKVGVIQDIIGNQRLLINTDDTDKMFFSRGEEDA